MLNNIYRLTGDRQIEQMVQTEDPQQADQVIVRPVKMSLCRADERYFTGSRDQAVLDQKLPMALVHEAMGVVIRDNSGQFEPGTRVAMVPTTTSHHHHDELVSDNYLRDSSFYSSSRDGFMRDYVFMDATNLVALPEDFSDDIGAFLELISVATQATKRLKETMIPRNNRIGIWGDGNVAYITAVVLKYMFPEAELYVFGKHQEKLDYIRFAKTMLIDEVPDELKLDHAIEAVGGRGSESAVAQIIDHIEPRGTIVLTGVSEEPILMNTRLVLEKGLDIVGSSRSTQADFKEAIEMIESDRTIYNRLALLIQERVQVGSVKEITEAFEFEMDMDWGKLIVDWQM